jgi:hypothetical protein
MARFDAMLRKARLIAELGLARVEQFIADGTGFYAAHRQAREQMPWENEEEEQPSRPKTAKPEARERSLASASFAGWASASSILSRRLICS